MSSTTTQIPIPHMERNDIRKITENDAANDMGELDNLDSNYNLPDISETPVETENPEAEMPDEQMPERRHIMFDFHVSRRPSHITVSTKTMLNNECVPFILHNRD